MQHEQKLKLEAEKMFRRAHIRKTNTAGLGLMSQNLDSSVQLTQPVRDDGTTWVAPTFSE